MNNNELFITNEVFENGFEGFDKLGADITLDNVNPWLLIAVYTGAAA